MFHLRKTLLILPLLSLSFLCATSSLSAQINLPRVSSDTGVVLVRTLPPTVDLSNKRIALEINSTTTIPKQSLDTLKVKLTTGLQADKRFIMDPANPATLVRLTATQLAITRKQSQAVIKGNPMDVTTLDGNLQVSFQALDAVSKQPLDSGNLEAKLQRNYYVVRNANNGKTGLGFGNILRQTTNALQTTQLTDQQAFDLLVSTIMGQVTRRMAQTEETIKVGRPDGELRKFRDKAEHKQWVSLYDDLADLTTLKDDDDKAQREYWMGISKEAIGYETKDRAQARQALIEAARHYDQAFQLKPDESMFLDSKHRAEESTVLLAGATPGQASPADSNSRDVAQNGGDEIMTNDVVIYLLNNKMSPEAVIAIIKDPSTKTKFDVGFAALGRLAGSKVPDNVIQAMRERAKTQ